MSSIAKLLFGRLTKNDLSAAHQVGHFAGIDLLRGIAAIAILLWHYQHFFMGAPIQMKGDIAAEPDKTSIPLFDVLGPIYLHGFWAVQLFWIISGFVFAHVYAGRKITAGDFFIARFARLYPLHFITLCVIAALQAIAISRAGGAMIVSTNDPYHFMLNLFFASSWTLQEGPSFNVPIWSVSVEVAVYALFFLLARHIFRAGIILPIVLIFFGVVMANRGTPFWLIWLCVLFFFIGTATYYLLLKLRRWYPVLISLSVASLLYWGSLAGAGQLEPFYNTTMFLFVPIIIIVGLFDFSPLFQAALRPIRFIGQSTYSMYLWHFPIQVAILIWMNENNISSELFLSPWALAAWLGGMIIVGVVSYHLIEKPAQRALKRWWSDREPTTSVIVPAE